MCGRFARKRESADYADLLGVDALPGAPSYNVAPTQPVPAVRAEGTARAAALLRWGLIPFWAKDAKSSFINARAETLADKPAFRAAFQKRRCLIPADGYYEWRAADGVKQPYYFRRRDDRPFAFAGLWDRWRGPDGPVESCTIITTAANSLSRPIHDRMPVLLTPPAFDLWLDPEIDDARALQELLQPFPSDELLCHPVRTLVNSPRNDRPACIEPAS